LAWINRPTRGLDKAVAPIVAPNNLHNLEPMIRQRAAEVLDSLPRIETFDWVEKVSIELTTMMLATLFVFPWKDKHLLTYWSDISITDINAPGALVTSDEERLGVQRKMRRYFATLWEERSKGEPGFDLVSMMVHDEATKNLSTGDLISTFVRLIVGGDDTTPNAMTGSLWRCATIRSNSPPCGLIIA